METYMSFEYRVMERTGLSLVEIPDAPEDTMMDGPIILSSPWGKIVYLDPTGEYGFYTRCVVVGRAVGVPLAHARATGKFTD